MGLRRMVPDDRQTWGGVAVPRPFTALKHANYALG